MSDEIKENEQKVLTDEELGQAAGGGGIGPWYDPSGFLIVSAFYQCKHFDANAAGRITGAKVCPVCTFYSVNALATSICTHSGNRKM